MNTTHNQHSGTEFRRSIVRLVTAGAIGVSALSIAFAAPAGAKGPHPGPVIDRPQPTSSLSAQNSGGRISTAPVRPAQRMAPGAIPRSQPATSVGAQQNAGNPAAAESDAGPATGSRGTARRADTRTPTMPGPLNAAEVGRLFGGQGAS